MWATILGVGKAILVALRAMPPASLKTKTLEIKGATAAEVNKMMQEFHRLKGK